MYAYLVINLKGEYQPSAQGPLQKELACKKYKGNKNGRFFRGQKLKDLSPLSNGYRKCRKNGRNGSTKREMLNKEG